MARAIEAFEETLVTRNSRFDRYSSSTTDALTAPEKRGLEIFMAKRCFSCHNGVNLGGTGYFRFGVVKRPGADVFPSTLMGDQPKTDYPVLPPHTGATPLPDVKVTPSAAN
jgi:cytochrome c peroxidase